CIFLYGTELLFVPFYSIDIRTAGADIIQFLSHNTPHLLFSHLQILKKQTKASVHDVQNNLPGSGVRKPPGRLHFPECAGYEKPEIQSLL
ncbi:TPA: hypothetical protein OD893_004860, partial [Escherichia coli]|nr:hypothetical protein [Escherichia coli]